MSQPWFNRDTFHGGEIVECLTASAQLFVKKGDRFRIEKIGNRAPDLIPHPDNGGAWKHNKTNPVRCWKHSANGDRRVFRLEVTVGRNDTRTFYLLQRNDPPEYTMALLVKDPDDDGPANGAAVNLRR